MRDLFAEYIEYMNAYRLYEAADPQQTVAYEEDLGAACMRAYEEGYAYLFEIVDYIPAGYEIWNIGKNMADGYLPICRLKNPQPYEGCMEIDRETLKAIKLDGAQTVLTAIYFGPKRPKDFERYIKRYEKSKTPYVARRVERSKAALEIMRTIRWEGVNV